MNIDDNITLKIGDKFHWWDKDLWHVVLNFTDDGNNFAILKSWSKYKHRWCYKIEHYWSINDFFEYHPKENPNR